MSLSPENKALVGHRYPLLGHLYAIGEPGRTVGIAEDELGRLLDDAREQGRVEARLEAADDIDALTYGSAEEAP